MIDPVTAIAGATAAFNTIKAGFAAGREIESFNDKLMALDGKLQPVTSKFEALIEGIETITGFDIQNNRIFEAFLVE